MSVALRNLYLLVSQRCNLTCNYCYAEGGHFGESPRLMDGATLRRAFDTMFPLASKSLVVSFFGGEPLLNFRLMQEAVSLGEDMAGKHGLRLRYALTTNGTVVSNDIVAFLREHVDYVAVSLDGDESVTDGQRHFLRGRRSVHATVLETLARFREAGIAFALRATVTESGMQDLLGTVRDFGALGASAIRLVPAFQVPGWKNRRLTRLAEELYAVNRDAMARAVAGEEPCYGEQFYRIRGFMNGERMHHPCDAANGVLAVAADGGVYPCDHFVGNTAFRMGSVHDSVWPGPEAAGVQALLSGNSVEQRPTCRGCDVRHICGGECPANSVAASGDISRPTTSHCTLMHRLYPAIGEALRRSASARGESQRGAVR
ncbi:MAG: SPASM domain-containing protein [Gammaproteobacteria bacterium]|nr:SPASM domain-containing protein [Gammaproteobacteria bacterium]